MFDEVKDEVKREIRQEFQKEWDKEKRKNPYCDERSWWAERRIGMKVFLGILMGLGVIALVFLFGWIVMLLWNALMPEIFGLTTLSYWQAWGLFLLSTILFKGIGSGSDRGGSRRDRRRKRELKRYIEPEPMSDTDTPQENPDGDSEV